MKVLIFGGFLGAGKTTVIMQMMHYMVSKDSSAMTKVVLLENEIGDSSIDDKIVSGMGMRVETIFSGCVCCSMAGEMIENIRYIEKKLDPEWLVLEATGMAYPSRVKENILEEFPETECHLICLADAKRWMRMQKVPELKLFSLEQMKGADVALVNKCDLVTADILKEVDASIKTISDKICLIHIVARDQIDESNWEKIFSWR